MQPAVELEYTFLATPVITMSNNLRGYSKVVEKEIMLLTNSIKELVQKQQKQVVSGPGINENVGFLFTETTKTQGEVGGGL